MIFMVCLLARKLWYPTMDVTEAVFQSGVSEFARAHWKNSSKIINLKMATYNYVKSNF